METMSTSKGKVVGKRILALAIFLVCLATIIVSLALPRALRKENETSFEPEENTLANDDIFGGGLQSIEAGFIGTGVKLLSEEPEADPATAVKPKICYQVAYNGAGDRISIRFAAAISSLEADTATWTRAMYQANGDNFSGLLSATQSVTVAYTGITHNGQVLYATAVEDENGNHPYHYFVVYSLLNIPVDTYANYVLDASLALTRGSDSIRSSVGAVQVDNSRHFTYEFGTPDYLTFTKSSRKFSAKGADRADVNATDVVIPAYYVDAAGRYPVTSIPKDGFNRFTLLQTVVIPETVLTIGSSAFYGCSSLTTVRLSEGLQTIEGNSFDTCNALTSIVIPDSVTTLSGLAFYHCQALTEATIGSGVTELTGSLFAYCGELATVNCRAAIIALGNSCFYECKKLETVNYAGTTTEWDNATKGSSWKTKTGGFTVHCTDGDVVETA